MGLTFLRCPGAAPESIFPRQVPPRAQRTNWVGAMAKATRMFDSGPGRRVLRCVDAVAPMLAAALAPPALWRGSQRPLEPCAPPAPALPQTQSGRVVLACWRQGVPVLRRSASDQTRRRISMRRAPSCFRIDAQSRSSPKQEARCPPAQRGWPRRRRARNLGSGMQLGVPAERSQSPGGGKCFGLESLPTGSAQLWSRSLYAHGAFLALWRLKSIRAFTLSQPSCTCLQESTYFFLLSPCGRDHLG